MRTKLSRPSHRSIPRALVVLGAGLASLCACSSPNAPSDGSVADAIDDRSTPLDARAPDAVVSDIADEGTIDPDSAFDAGAPMDAADDDAADSADALATDTSDGASDAEPTDGITAADANGDANDSDTADARDASAVTDVAVVTDVTDVPDAAPMCPAAAIPMRAVDLVTGQRVAVRVDSTVSDVRSAAVEGGIVLDSSGQNAFFVGRAPTPQRAACTFAEQVTPSGWVYTWCSDQNVSPTSFIASRLAALGTTAMVPSSMARMAMGQVAYSMATGALVVSSTDAATRVLPAEGPDAIAPSATSALANECIAGVAPPRPAVDIVFVVDDSGSMGPYQAGLSRMVPGFFDRLTAAGIDWRAAAVTTSYYSSATTNSYRTFTTNTELVRCWFANPVVAGTCTAANSRWLGNVGLSDERALQSTQQFMRRVLLPATATPQADKLRAGAQLVFIVLGDADDQWTDPAGSITTLTTYFNNYDGAGSAAVLHAIVCPDGQTCGETQTSPRRIRAIADATAGIKFSIYDAASSTVDPTRLVAADIIAHAGPRAPANAIGHSVRSAGGACTPATAPHNGFAWHAAPRARLGTSLACRPAPGDATRVGLVRWTP